MEKLINQTIFKCSYCSRISMSAAGIYSHELSCRKNPHNKSLCSTCKHCKKQESYTEIGVRCVGCKHRELAFDKLGRLTYLSNCQLMDNNQCDGRQKIVDFICDIDGCKMYSNKIHRLSSEKAKKIKKRCDKPMANAASGCDNYEYNCNTTK